MSEASLHCRFSLQRGDFSLDCELALPGAGFSVLFGRSGCGKTTLLRCIAGLERAEGELRLGEHCWQSGAHVLPTHRRPLAYVFQEARLFPHLSARDNLRFGFERIPADQRRVVLDEAVNWLGLERLLSHMPHQLSGGQKQRVAIARALLTSPRLLLMDEPLASLDLDSKAEILPYLERLRSALRIPVIYVTHAPEEMSRLADHLVLLEAGRVRASGPLNTLLTRTDLPLLHQLDASAVLSATISQHDPHYHLSQLSVPGGQLTVALSELPPGSATRVRILARDVSIALQPPEHSSISNCLPACIVDLTPDPDPARMLVRLDLGGAMILSRITRRSADTLRLAPGQLVYAQIKAVALMG